MSVGLYEHVMDEHAHEVSSVAYLETIMVKLFLLLNINNANSIGIEDM